mgnify:CR=1 FL=1
MRLGKIEDEQIQEAQEWLFDNFDEQIEVADLAARVGMSPRNFTRRFKAASGTTPIRYLQGLRINAARHYLENETRTVGEVSRAVGYEDLAFFRELFKRETGMPPRAYRQRFNAGPPPAVAVEGRTPHH